MPVLTPTNFNIQAQIPIDARLTQVDITARDDIATPIRYWGMLVHVLDSNGNNIPNTYILQKGTTSININDNGNWIPINGVVYTTTTSGISGTSTIDIPLDSSVTVIIEIKVVGGETDSAPTMFASGIFGGLYHRDGGGIAVKDGTTSIMTYILSSAATAENVSITLTASGNNARITIIGPDTTSTAMNWKAIVNLTKVSSN